jgi:hypothetical protein
MTNMIYPTIDIEEFDKLTKLLEEAITDPNILDPSVCPYDPAIAEKLKKLTNWLHPAARASLDDGEKNPVGRPTKKVILPIEEIENEINDLRKDISQLKVDAKGLETADRIQIIKTRATLFEKMIAIKERTNNMKKQQQFVSTVIAIMEDIMEQPQREKMIKLMEPYIDQ